MAFFKTLWIDNGAVLKSFCPWQLKIHAIRPGLSGTVPDFDTLSRHPGNYEIVPEI